MDHAEFVNEHCDELSAIINGIRDSKLQTRLFGNFSGARDLVVAAAGGDPDDLSIIDIKPCGNLDKLGRVVSVISSDQYSSLVALMDGMQSGNLISERLVIGLVRDHASGVPMVAAVSMACEDGIENAVISVVNSLPRTLEGDSPLADPPLGSHRQFRAALTAPSPVRPGGPSLMSVLGTWCFERCGDSPTAKTLKQAAFVTEFEACVRRVLEDPDATDAEVTAALYEFVWPGAAAELEAGRLVRKVWRPNRRRTEARAADLQSFLGAYGDCVTTLADLGCDDGAIVATLAQRLGLLRDGKPAAPGAAVYGVEVSHVSLPPGVELIERSATDAAVFAPQSLDLVITLMTLHHVGAWRTLVANAARWLRPGGFLLVRDHECGQGETAAARRLMLDLHDLLFATVVYHAQEQSYTSFAAAAFNNFSSSAAVIEAAAGAGLELVGQRYGADVAGPSLGVFEHEPVDAAWVRFGCVYYAAFRKRPEPPAPLPPAVVNPFTGIEADTRLARYVERQLGIDETAAGQFLQRAASASDVPELLRYVGGWSVSERPQRQSHFASARGLAQLLQRVAPLPEAPTGIVSVGCGSGADAAALGLVLGSPPASVFGLDVCPQTTVDSGVNYRCWWGGALPLPAGSCRLVYSRLALHHMASHDALPRQFAQLLCPGGVLCLIDADIGDASVANAAHIVSRQARGEEGGATVFNYPDFAWFDTELKRYGLRKIELSQADTAFENGLGCAQLHLWVNGAASLAPVSTQRAGNPRAPQRTQKDRGRMRTTRRVESFGGVGTGSGSTLWS